MKTTVLLATAVLCAHAHAQGVISIATIDNGNGTLTAMARPNSLKIDRDQREAVVHVVNVVREEGFTVTRTLPSFRWVVRGCSTGAGQWRASDVLRPRAPPAWSEWSQSTAEDDFDARIAVGVCGMTQPGP
jgi:hypothetical protein